MLISFPAGAPLTGPFQLTLYGAVPPFAETIAVPEAPPKHRTGVGVAVEAIGVGAVIRIGLITKLHPFTSLTVTAYDPVANPAIV